MNTVTQTLQHLRAPLDKKVQAAQAAHAKTVADNKKLVEKAEADLNKTIATAKAEYEEKVKKAQTSVAISETHKKEAEEERTTFMAQVQGFANGAATTKKTNGAGAPIKHTTVKPTTTKAAKVKAAPKAAKPAKVKAAPKTKAKPVKTKSHGGPKNAGAKRALQGRDEVRNGVRPPIKDAIRLILGKKTIRSRDITAELIARKWAPNSKNPASYVPYVLSNGCKGGDKAVFESVDTGKGRGFYRVRHGAPAMDAKVRERFGGVTTPETAAAAPVAKAAPKAAKPKTAKAAPGGPRKCSVPGCGVLGHNKRGHAAYVKAQKAGAKAAPAPKKAAAAPKKAAAPKAPKAAAAPKERAGKGQQKCGMPGCGVLGHNKKGHDAWVKAQAGGKEATPKATTKKAAPAAEAKPVEAAAKPEAKVEAAPEPKATPTAPATEPTLKVKTADEIVAEAQASSKTETKDSVMEEAAQAFGT